MARTNGRLTALSVQRANKPGLYADGNGLYLQVTGGNARSWIFRYRWQGRRRDMGLGSLTDVPLAKARRKAVKAREALGEGRDPIEARRAQAASEAAERAHSVPFQTCAAAYIEAHSPAWRNAKHVAQWSSTLETYAYPRLGPLPVSLIDVSHVLEVLKPIWTEKPETATRLRGRIEAILDWAAVRGYRTGENPARWRGHLQRLLPSPSKVRRIKHHPALPYAQIGEFMAELRQQEGVAALALEFLILTATRTSETIGARWDEIDLDNGIWTIPSDRIKAGKEHRVPLSPPALAIVKRVAKVKDSEFVFPGGRKGKPLSTNALLALMKRMERTDITPHGFRSTFRDWAAETTNYPRDVAEMALAHAIGDKVEAAYRRGELMEKRARLMADWARFCGTVQKGGTVVPIGRRKA